MRSSWNTAEIDGLASLQITPEFFSDLCNTPEFREVLRELDIPDEEQLDLFDTLDIDGGGTLDLEELIQGVSKLRGDARRSDIVSVSLMVRALQEDFREFEVTLRNEITALTSRTKAIVQRSMTQRIDQ